MSANALDLMVPILIAALGGLLTERAGVLNVGLEGLILVGAFASVVGANLTGSFAVGFVFGCAAGLTLAALYSVACIELRANIFVAGLATNLLAAGIVPYASALVYGTRGVVRLAVTPGFPRVFGVSVTVPLAVVVALAVSVALFETPFGIRLRATGGNPAALVARALRPDRYRRIAMLASGVFAGAAGAEVALRLGVYLPNISAGRGWIALVAIFLGVRHPLGIVAAAFVFALFESFAGAAQGFTDIPGTLLLGLPYLITLAAMISYSAVGRSARIER
jgi:general nucleoside transport system permease protein